MLTLRASAFLCAEDAGAVFNTLAETPSLMVDADLLLKLRLGIGAFFIISALS